MGGLLMVLGVLEVRERLTKLTPCLDKERESGLYVPKHVCE